jgi:hypothetical protein
MFASFPRRSWQSFALATLATLAVLSARPAAAQGIPGGGSGGGLPGGSAGGSSFGGGGSTFGGSSTTFSGGGSTFSGGSTTFSGGSTTFSGGSMTFSGGSSTFSGGSTTFSGGGTTFGGGSLTTTPGAGGRIGSTTSTGPTAANPFQATYSNPLAVGLPGNNRSTTFGSPMYRNVGTAVTTGTTTGRTGVLGSGIASGVGTANISSNGAVGASSIGVRRAPQYITELSSDVPLVRPAGPVGPLRVQTELQSVIGRSSSLPSRGNIQVLTDGQTVVLRGQVTDERERRLAEGVVRLTPGVRDVRNELQVANRPPGP